MSLTVILIGVAFALAATIGYTIFMYKVFWGLEGNFRRLPRGERCLAFDRSFHFLDRAITNFRFTGFSLAREHLIKSTFLA
ncbi:hypothetical protein ACSFA8_27040 [Variovorax sp. RT4R15]|uniref:hypothetical protein n=1 Tax=Variovorax sp. RT4R15 TaxID=3443737 RepID=UPI003F44A9D2